MFIRGLAAMVMGGVVAAAASDLAAPTPSRSGYAPGYLWQSVRGHLSVWWSGRAVDEWLADPATEPQLRQRLELARRIRRFASDELGLPDNGSFTRYAQLDRPFVVWNVQAAPELSLEPVRWCFPVAGCVAYRGYYRREDAEAFASGLRAEGLDVQLAGVAAYSTLGWFDDLLLSTFISLPEPELAQLIFHELAHQVVWVPGDTRFNESFATAVERIGVERWLAANRADPQVLGAWLGRRERREQILALLLDTATRLRTLYQSSASDDDKRAGKQRAITGLREGYASLRAQSAEYSGWDRWFGQALGNAHLMSVGLYHDLVPAFLALYREQGQDLQRFHAQAKAIAALAPEARAARLAALAALR